MTPFSARIHAAFDFAAIHHRKQMRKDPDIEIPYIAHLFGVAYILASHDLSEDTVVAGVLHDFLEDIVEKKRRPKLAIEFRTVFGEHVYQLVRLVTHRKKDEHGKDVPWEVRTAEYVSRLSSPSTPNEAKAISCADKIHNIESLLIALDRNTANPNRMWNKLKKTPKEQLEKFRALHDGISTHWQHPLVADLASMIQKLEKALPYERPKKIGLIERLISKGA